MPTSDGLPLSTPRGGTLAAERRHATDKRRATDRAVAIVGPVLEQLARHATQIVAESFGLIVAAVDQRLKIPFQMGPAPLQAADPPVHLRPIAGHDAAKRGRRLRLSYRCRPFPSRPATRPFTS